MPSVCFEPIEGPAAYEPVFRRQMRLREAVEHGTAPNTVLLVEHAPVITLGRRARKEHVLADAQMLARHGVELVATDRGGDVTYHGPGQLTAYPVLNLDQWDLTMDAYLRGLEEVVIRMLVRWGLQGGREPGYTGVWVGGAKVAAIGVGMRRRITWHGVALNLNPDPAHWRMIVPCGIHGRPVTSLAQLLPDSPAMCDAVAAFVEGFCGVFDCAPVAAAKGRP